MFAESYYNVNNHMLIRVWRHDNTIKSDCPSESLHPASASPSATMPPPSTQHIFTKAAFEVVAAIVFGAAWIYVHTREPFQRGFYCDDETILHPYTQPEKYPATVAFVIWAVVWGLVVIPVELFRNQQIKKPKHLTAGPVPLPWLLLDLYRVLGNFFQGGLATLLITEVAKVSIGRLRPHFLTLCVPHAINCSTDHNKFYGTTDAELKAMCTNYKTLTVNGEAVTSTDFDSMMREARLSFLSGWSYAVL